MSQIKQLVSQRRRPDKTFGHKATQKRSVAPALTWLIGVPPVSGPGSERDASTRFECSARPTPQRLSLSQRGAFVGAADPRGHLFYLVPINSESQMAPLHTLKPDFPA
jgi:hypothetical protein